MANLTSKFCAGEYLRTDGRRTVAISRLHFSDGWGWIAQAEWDQQLYTDPIRTKKLCVHYADQMLASPIVP